MLKSKIEVREYALNKAIELLGTSTPTKQVVEKAKEIETYIIGEAELPETIDEKEVINTILEVLTGVAIGWLNHECNGCYTPVMEKEIAAKEPEKTE